MAGVLEDMSEDGVVRAIDANIWEFWANFGHAPASAMEDSQVEKWVITGILAASLNGVFYADFGDDAEEIVRHIEDTLGHFRERGVPLVWRLGPTSKPADLGAYLERAGLTHAADAPGMAVDLQGLDTTAPNVGALRIERVRSVEQMREYMVPFNAAYGFSEEAGAQTLEAFVGLGPEDGPLRHYIGYMDGEAVGTSTSFYGAGVAGIYNVATLPSKRGHGIGSVLTLAPLVEARDAGYRVGVLYSSASGYGVYRRLGFKKYCKIGMYVMGAQ